MIAKSEYLKAKAIVEEYEQEEINQSTIEAMYCVSCQAFEEHDCFCDEHNEDGLICSYCSYDNGTHGIGCPYDHDPYNSLLRDGYD